MGLMKLATYFRNRKDDVRFFKGDFRDLAVELLFEDYWKKAFNNELGEYTLIIRKYIKDGKIRQLENIPNYISKQEIHDVRLQYKAEDYPKYGNRSRAKHKN